MMRAAILALVALIGAVTLASCTSSPTVPSNAQQVSDQAIASSSPDVIAALSDGVVSRDDYDAGYRRFAACMDAGGIPLLDQPMEEDTHYYGVPQEAVDSGLYDRCYNLEFYAIDVAWQIAHPTIATRLSTCLYLAGDSFVGTVEEMKQRLIEIGKDPEACLAGK